jgi:mannosyltransferase
MESRPLAALRASNGSTPRKQLAVLIGIVLVGLALRCYQLDARSFWFDEAFSWRLIQFPLGEMIQRVAADNHPPLYFILLKAWAAVFGESAWVLRGLSVLLGGATIVGLYLFVIEAFDRNRGLALFTAVLVALGVFQIRWAWEVRMYTLGTALAAFSSWAMFRMLHRPTLGRAAAYGLLALAFVYTHYYALFTMLAQAIFCLGWVVRAEPLVRRALLLCGFVATAVVIVGFAPWLPALLRQRAQVQSDFWTRPVSTWDFPFALYGMLFEPENTTYDRASAALGTGLCGAVVCAALYRASTGARYAVLATVVPMAMCALVSYLDTKIFTLRYFLFANLFFLVCLASLVWRIPTTVYRGIVAGYLLACALAIDVAFWQGMAILDKPGAQAAIAYIEQHKQPGEQVVVCSPVVYLSMLYHAPDRDDWHVYLHDPTAVKHYNGGPVLLESDYWDDERLRNYQQQRIWVVNMHGGGWDPTPVPGPATWTLVEAQDFPEVYRVQGVISVALYENSSSR